MELPPGVKEIKEREHNSKHIAWNPRAVKYYPVLTNGPPSLPPSSLPAEFENKASSGLWHTWRDPLKCKQLSSSCSVQHQNILVNKPNKKTHQISSNLL